MKCRETRENGQTVAAFDNACFLIFFLSHDGLEAITAFIFHCVNLRGADDFSMCIFFVRGGVDSVGFFFFPSLSWCGGSEVYFVR